MSNPQVYAIIGAVPPGPGPGPIATVAEYFRYRDGAAALLRAAAAPGVPTADRILARDIAGELIAATEQVVNNPALWAEVQAVIVARREAPGRTEGWII